MGGRQRLPSHLRAELLAGLLGLLAWAAHLLCSASLLLGGLLHLVLRLRLRRGCCMLRLLHI